MELAKAALSSLIPKLGALLTAEYNLQKGVRGEIRFLECEMKSMQAALEDLSDLPADQISNSNKLWMRDLRELSYDIEDSVDSFMVRVDSPAKQHSLTGFRSFIDRIGIIGKAVIKAKNRRSIAMDIEEIKVRMKDVIERRKRYLPDVIMVPERKLNIDPRVIGMFEEANRLIGIDGPAEKLTNMLMQGESVEKQKLMVVSIVGVGGLGKTTLANSVYKELGGQFQCQAFVPVSLKPDMKNILCSILRQISREKCKDAGEKDDRELIENIRHCLSDKRYLIVIDDIWDTAHWKILNSALIDNHCGSRVIVTTRNLEVGKSCRPTNFCTRGAVYELQPLSDPDSKRLLYTRVFNKEEEIDTQLDEVAEKILKKCAGLPLAITTIAGLLASKPKTKAEWYAVYNSICSGPNTPKDNMETMRVILSLSFSELPSHLKPCLLYLSFFPEDCIIHKDSLIRRWVAEGLIDGKHGGKDFFELCLRGERYFVDLVNRSFIQPIDIDLEGIANNCRVHDIILDLLISLSIQENFVVRSDYMELIDPLCCKIRRLSLQDNDKKQEIMQPTADVSHVRSVIAFGDTSEQMPPLSRFSVLRVLDLEGFPKNSSPKDLRKLHHLKYLQLMGYLRKEVLEEIGNLWHLEVLDLSKARINALPASIVNLTNLKCLLVDYRMTMPVGIGKLSQLQVISWIRVAQNTVTEIGKLAALRVLQICGLGCNENYDKACVQSLSNLENLECLFIDQSDFCSLDGLSDTGPVPARLKFFIGESTTFHQLPRWFSKLELLSGLQIIVRKFTQEDLEMLGELPSLRFLKLEVHENRTAQEQLVIGNPQHFKSLEEMKFFHSGGCLMVFAERVMQMLQKLEFFFQLWKRVGGGLDIGLENLTSLKHVTVKVDCYKAKIMELENVESMFKDVVRIHPNYPTLELSRVREWEMAEGESCDSLRLPIMEVLNFRPPMVKAIMIVRLQSKLRSHRTINWDWLDNHKSNIN